MLGPFEGSLLPGDVAEQAGTKLSQVTVVQDLREA